MFEKSFFDNNLFCRHNSQAESRLLSLFPNEPDEVRNPFNLSSVDRLLIKSYYKSINWFKTTL